MPLTFFVLYIYPVIVIQLYFNKVEKGRILCQRAWAPMIALPLLVSVIENKFLNL